MCQNLSCWFTPLSNSFDFFPRSFAIKEFFSKPKYNHILQPEDCLSEPCTILQLDMRSVQIADLENHPLEAGAVYDGRARVRALGRCDHRLGYVAEKPRVEEAHVRGTQLVRHFHTRPHIAESWREGLSHLEMRVEVVGSRCCRNEPGASTGAAWGLAGTPHPCHCPCLCSRSRLCPQVSTVWLVAESVAPCP
uniref:Uncharacterized protein n=1 Tax=Canis lupus familiaris TaxID=9615 RepID=A0A8C0THQ5_CANLF